MRAGQQICPFDPAQSCVLAYTCLMDTPRFPPRLAQDVSRPANDFRQTFFGTGANPLTVWSVQRAVSALVHANDYAGLQRATAAATS